MAGQPAYTAAAPKVRTRRGWVKQFHKYKYYYILLAPGLLYFLLFKYLPIAGIAIAFKDYKLNLGIWGSHWAGLKWFHILFSTSDFWAAFRNTIIISFYKLIFGFPAPILLAILLNEVMHNGFKRTVQTVIYFPHFLSWVVLGGIMFTILSPDTGIMSWFGVKTSPLMNPGHFRGLLVVSGMWKEMGWGTIVYLAAIAGINPELYEAGRIDGATRLQLIRFITLPSIAGTIVVMLILRMGYILQAGFDQVYILYNPVVYNVADILDTYVYRTGLTMGRFSYATAAGLFQSAVGLLMLLFSNWFSRRVGEQGLW